MSRLPVRSRYREDIEEFVKRGARLARKESTSRALAELPSRRPAGPPNSAGKYLTITRLSLLAELAQVERIELPQQPPQ